MHYGEDDATTSNGIKVPAGSYYEPFIPGKSEIHAISASGTQNVIVTEDKENV